MAKPLALLFDMDGTIVDNMSVHNRTWLELLERHGKLVDEKTFFDQTAGMTNPQIFRILLDPEMSDEQIAILSSEKESIYRERYSPHIAPMPGLEDLMAKAKSLGIKLGLATSAPPENIEFILGGTGLEFDAVVGAKDITHGKPHPEIYHRCAEILGCKAEDCIVFEDAPMGIESGVRSGARVIVITTVLSHEEALSLTGVEGALADFTTAQALLD